MESLMLEQIEEKANTIDPIGGSLKILIDDKCIHIDGKGDRNIVSSEDKDADCTIQSTMEVLDKLKNGKLNPALAVMTKKIKIKGDPSLVMKLQSLV